MRHQVSSVLLVLLIIVAGVWAPAEAQQPPEIEAVKPEAIPPSVLQAMLAMAMWRAGRLDTLPFVTGDPEAFAASSGAPDLSAFSPTFQWLDEFSEDEDGTVTLGMLLGMADGAGRVDMSINRLRYRPEAPDDEARTAIVEWLLRNPSFVTAKAEGSAGSAANAIAEFQEQAGLPANGVFDAATARALAPAYSMIRLIAAESHIFYPEPPGHAVLIVPYDKLLDQPDLFSAGFESLPRVLERAVGEDELERTGLGEGQYAAFVYFMDRVEPERNVQLKLAAKGASRSLVVGKTVQAEAGKWLVIVQDFFIGKQDAARDLELIVLIDDERVAELPINNAR
jgi:hypothetical protein